MLTAEIVDVTTIRSLGDLDFGNIMPNATGGTVVVPASATPTCTATGGLLRSGPCLSPPFEGIALHQATLKVMRPNGNKITLTGPGGATMEVDTFTFDSTGPTVYLDTNGANSRFRIDATDGAYRFFVGATLHVNPNQMPGIYNGTFEIRISYQ